MKQNGIFVAANYLGSRLQADPELELPHRPRLPPEIIVLPFGPDGLLFEGGKTTQVLTGTSSRTLLPAVLAQLDGTKSCEEIAAAVPHASVNQIKNIVTLLFSCGLLEDGLSPLPPEEFRELDAFFGRFVDVTRNNGNRGEAMARLCGASIAIAGTPQPAELITSQLTRSGARCQLLGNGGLESLTKGQLLVAVATRESEDLAHLLTAAHERGVRVLHVRIGKKEARIGPLFIPDRTACYECTRVLYPLPEGDANPTLLPMWLSMASLQAVHIVARTADVRLFGGFESYEQTPHGFLHRFRYVARLPGCDRCAIRASEHKQQSGELLAWLYHSSVAMPPQEVGSRRAYQRHYLAQNVVETQRPPEAFHGAAVIPLPQVVPSSDNLAQTGPPDRGINLYSLGALLRFSVGYQVIEQEGLRRIAPTGGGMGSPELFVIAKAVEGLRSGLYHYHAPHHVLERLREAVPEDITAPLGLTSWHHACTIIATGALHKLRSKYQNFAYRIVNLDSGVALHILREIAAAQYIPTRLAPDIHDEGVARLITLPRRDNRFVVTFALGLGGSTIPSPLEFTNLGLRILDVLISESTLAQPSEHHITEPVEDKQGGRPVGALYTHLLNRRTVREYEGRPVSKMAVLALANAVSSADRRYQADAPLSAPLHQWWFVRVGSPQFPAGIYEFESTSEQLIPRGPNPGDDEMRQCLNQTALAAAPLILFLTANLGANLRTRGARGYREVLLQAGNACGTVLISAETISLGACTTAGILEPGFRHLTSCDGYNECPIVAITLGHYLRP